MSASAFEKWRKWSEPRGVQGGQIEQTMTEQGKPMSAIPHPLCDDKLLDDAGFNGDLLT